MLTANANNGEEMETLPEKQDQIADTEPQFGWGTFRPKVAQRLTNPVAFIINTLVLTSPAVILSWLLPNIQIAMVIRFKLSEKEWNGLIAAQGVSAMAALVVMGYLGGFCNKIRWIAAGMVMTAIGAILFCIPHFVIDKYEPANLPAMFLNQFGLCKFPPIPCPKPVEHSHLALFVIGQMFIGAGVAPLYSLVPAYIDENVKPESMPIYMMVWFLNLLVAPIAGFLTAVVFLQFYVDIKQPDLFVKMEPDDIRWIGAWWLPFLIFAIVTFVNAAVFLGFPQRLPGSRAICIENMQQGNIPRNDKNIKSGPLGFLYSTVSLLKNKPFIFNTLAVCCIVFYLVPMGPFLIRVLMIKYGADPKHVGMPFGIVLAIGTIAGIVLGGFLIKRIGVKRVAKGAAFICLITQAVSLVTPLMFVIPGCNESNIAGVSASYPPLGKQAVLMQKDGSSELTSTCNAECKCSTFISKPVCGSNDVAYFDPCHAGCTARPSKKNFANCTCVPPTKHGYTAGEAKLGFCDRGCKSWAFFLVVLFFVLMIIGTNVLPSKVVVLRCVPHNQRCYALSVQAFLTVLVSLIASHLIKYIMDKDCNIWQTDLCGNKGICWDYKANSMTKSIAIFGFLVTAAALIFYFLSWYYYEPPKSSNNGRLLSDIPDDDDSYDKSKETNL